MTGGGRGTAAIAAHFNYISKNGRIAFEDDRGVVRDGRDALHDIVEQWRWGGSVIENVSLRREAFHVMLLMPVSGGPNVFFFGRSERVSSSAFVFF